jgi:hypothetical protein
MLWNQWTHREKGRLSASKALFKEEGRETKDSLNMHAKRESKSHHC